MARQQKTSEDDLEDDLEDAQLQCSFDTHLTVKGVRAHHSPI